MPVDKRQKAAAKLAADYTTKYGDKAATVGSHPELRSRYYSTGVTALDYMLGTGGLPDNAFAEIFGPPGIGKTTTLGAAILASVHKAGGITATIATEPDVDEAWLARHGVDPEYNVIFRPDTGEEAFVILRDLIYARDVDYVLWDSLAATSSAKEQQGDVPMAFGNAQLNTWGVKNVAVRAFKNRVGVTFINQIRDDPKSRIPGMVKSPGGHALEHMMKIRIQLKPGKDRYKIKVRAADNKGNDDLQVGRQIRASIVKDKAAEELGNQAVFDFYQVETNGLPFGIDRGADILNIGRVTGVIEGAGWFRHEVFPDGKINGTAAAQEFFRANEKAYEAVRKDVLKVMSHKERELAAKKKSAKNDEVDESE